MTRPGGLRCDDAGAVDAGRAGDAAARSGTVPGSGAAARSAAPPAQRDETLIVERDESLLGDSGAAWFSQDRAYRYLLTRRWGGPARRATFIMLNPSTADAFADDPTIRRCIRFAKREDCGGLNVVNLFAWRATDPRELHGCLDPIGPDNHLFIIGSALGSTVVAAWGAHGTIRGQGQRIAGQLAEAGIRLLCLGVTKDGHPKHPLARGRERIPDDAPLIPWEAPS